MPKVIVATVKIASKLTKVLVKGETNKQLAQLLTDKSGTHFSPYSVKTMFKEAPEHECMAEHELGMWIEETKEKL